MRFKHRILPLALGLSLLGVVPAAAQSVLIVKKDGTQAKFNADYVQSITFEDANAAQGAFMLSDYSPYSGGNLGLNFANEDGSTTVALDLYGDKTDTYLKPGVYTVGASAGQYIDNTYATYTNVTIDEELFTIASGTLTVGLEGDAYSFFADFVLDEGQKFKFEVEEAFLPKYGPVVKLVGTQASYLENELDRGNIYVNIHDDSWSFESSWDFYTDPSATELPAGTYKFSENNEPGTYSSYTYINSYSPYSTYEAKGDIVVARDGANYSITLKQPTDDGRELDFSFYGPINGKPVFKGGTEEPAGALELTKAQVTAYGKNGTVTLMSADGQNQVCLDMWCSQPYLEAGDFTIDPSGNPFTIDPTYSYVFMAGNRQEITSGNVTVALEGHTFTISGTLQLKDNSEVSFKYVGALNAYTPWLDIVLSSAVCQGYNVVPGEFYVKMHDEDWHCEMAIDFFATTDATSLPAGTYTYSEEQAAGHFGPSSTVSMYSPYGDVDLTATEIKVEKDGDNYKISFASTLKASDAELPITFVYEGQLPVEE